MSRTPSKRECDARNRRSYFGVRIPIPRKEEEALLKRALSRLRDREPTDGIPERILKRARDVLKVTGGGK
jgi:hypothetical protein